MTTAQAIENIKDAGMFEILATRVLRIIDKDCQQIEHLGVNADGKTRGNPIDCFCQVPETNPPRFVIAEFNTEDNKTLKAKWLRNNDNSKDGDLIKASRRAKEILKTNPQATFIVYLCTNKQPNDRLITEVINKGNDLGLEVKFLTQSKLRDFLDVNPDGQWLRKEHLGINADRVSLPLLQELSEKSKQQYEKEFLITHPDNFISTSSERDIISQLKSSQSLYVVTGPSGSGKSVSCFQVLNNHLKNGGIGLWIPGDIAVKSNSIEEAINYTLKSLYPTIESKAAEATLRICDSSIRLIIIIDDINKNATPHEILKKIATWAQPSTNKDKETGNKYFSPYKVIVPAWDIYWTPHDTQFRSVEWLLRIPIKKMNDFEAIECLSTALGSKAFNFTKAETRKIVKELEYDPILIALYSILTKDSNEYEQQISPHNVINRFVTDAEAELAQSSDHLQGEYDQVLLLLAESILKQRDLFPQWHNVQKWIPNDKLQALRELVKVEKICRLKKMSDDGHFEFRHDRILEHFLVRAIKPMLDDAETNAEVLSDPFYASFVGHAVAISQPSDKLLQWLRQYAPLAIISAIHFLANTPEYYKDRIVITAKTWLELASKDINTPSSLLFAAFRVLENTDSTYVLDITQPLAMSRKVALARLANGDAAAGAIEFSDTQWFSPATTDYRLDEILNRALCRHKQQLINDCKAILQNSQIKEADVRGTLVLAGFIAENSLASSIQIAWNTMNNKKSILLYALWAGLRCYDKENGIIDNMFTVFADLPDNDMEGKLSEQMYIAQELKFAIQKGISQQALNYLVTKAKTDRSLRWPITFMLEHVDSPVVLKFLIEEAADSDRRLKGTNKISPWKITFLSYWDPTVKSQGKRLSQESVLTIKSLWESETSDYQLSKTAFQFWLRTVDDLATLKSIPNNHPQYESVIWRRATLGDLSVTTLVKSLAKSDDKWFHVISNIWSEEFVDLIDTALLKLKDNTPTDYTDGRSNEHYALAHLLRDIPIKDAQPLLEKHWEHLKFSRLFIHVALYVGTPKCISLVDESINNYPSNIDPLEYIGSFFGFFESGLSDRINMQHLKVLLPYIERLGSNTLSNMVEFCERHNKNDWSIEYLKPEFERRRAILPQDKNIDQKYIENITIRHFPSNNDLFQELDSIEQRSGSFSGSLYYWSENFKRRQDSHKRWREILIEWFSYKPTIERFRLYTAAISDHGKRSDIDMLNHDVIDGDVEKIERLRADTIFEIKRRTLQ
ncbi:MAG: hypothetical protein JXB49_08855 [Bacteroidales bacterium]|nr:hypothetical protein [Bacteroidales bacterium]